MFILLVLLQVSLFNQINLFGIATPVVYIYFLIKLPVRLNRNVVLLLAALMGLAIDTFGYTLGLNMLIMVISGFMRYWLLYLFTPRDITDNVVPSFSTFGRNIFLRYAGTATLLHIILLNAIETGAFAVPHLLALRIAGSFALSYMIIYGFEILCSEK
ncbi:MAG: rod shape-determining protein MreD [Dysgonamonadaceae bacterium]|nr:rod shape-determining protein MreD [Dysgonamonadaceae bacterium]